MAGDSAGGKEVGRISIRVVPDLKDFRAKLAAELKAIEDSMKATIKVEADIDSDGAKAHMRVLMAELKAQAAKGVTVNTKIDNDSIGRGLSSLASGAGAAGDGFSLASRGVLIFTAVLLGAAPAVGLVAGLLAGLPSLLLAFGSGAGAIALGLDGIKTAAKTLTPQFDALKASVSAVFESRLGPIFQQLSGIFPTITTGMNAVAGGLADIFQGFTNVVTSATGMSQINTILSRTAGFFTGLAPIVSTFTQSFLTLGTAGANAFSLLLGPLQKFATGFNEMVNKITSNGSFNAAMQGLSTVLDSVLTLFTRLFDAGITAMGQLGGPLTTLINGLGDAFIALMPALTSLSAVFANVLGTALTAIAPAITALTPAFTLFADTLGTLLTNNLTTLSPLLTQLATTLGGAFTTALTTLQPMLPGLAASFSNLVTSLVTGLAPVLPQLATSFGTLAGALLQLSPTIMQTLADSFTQIAPAIPQMAAGFASFLASITPLIPQIASLATEAIKLTPAFLAAIPSILQIVGAIGGLVAMVATAASKVSEFAGKVVTEITSLPGKIQGAIAGFGSLLINAGIALMNGLLSGIKAGAEAVYKFVAGIAARIAALKGPISYDKTVLTPNGQALMQGLQDGIEGGLEGVLQRASAIAGQINDAMNSGGTIQVDGLKDQLKRAMDELTLESKDLKVQFDAIPKTDKTARQTNQDQRATVQSLRDQLSLQSEQLGFSQKYGDNVKDASTNWADIGKKLATVGTDFAKATGQQAMSDLGISGNGALTGGLMAGLDWLTQFGTTNIHVNSLDEGFAAKQNQTNKRALQYTQR